MLTNKEIIRNQLERINEKAGTSFKLESVWGRCDISEDVSFGKISANCTAHNTEQMIDDLAGLEDGIDCLMKQRG